LPHHSKRLLLHGAPERSSVNDSERTSIMPRLLVVDPSHP
jgi:hypothetical protein